MKFTPTEIAIQPGKQPAFVSPGQFMLPDPENVPVPGPQHAVHEAITGAVAAELLPPEIRVLLRLRRVQRTSVPEAPIDEDGEFKLWKNEVGLAWKFRTTAPAGDVVAAQEGDEPQFRGAIAGASDARHESRAFSFGEDVGQGS